MQNKLIVNIVGASGYTGAELIRIILSHPHFSLRKLYAQRNAGIAVGDIYPHLRYLLPDSVFASTDDGDVADCDVLFLALPHTQSHSLVKQLPKDGPLVIDLSADFRFEDITVYEQWYNTSHQAPEYQSYFQYGLVEFYREKIRDSRFIAAPGCYPTSAILPIKPLVDLGLHNGQPIIVDAASGVSGAGATPTETTIFSNIESNFTAYGLIHHRHTPEMVKEVGQEILFTPHLVPMVRGIVATCYIPTDTQLSEDELYNVYIKQYGDDPFVHPSRVVPSTKQVAGTNNAVVYAVYDERTKYIIAICAIDNLMKGASGQAVQAANIALGIDETTGLEFTALYP